MNIQKVQNNLIQSLNFGAVVVPNKQVRVKILKGLSEKQVSSLRKRLIEQQENPVHAIISLDKIRLKANLCCRYRLKGFKETYKQFPLLESDLAFVKRIIEKCDEYKKQLEISFVDKV